MIVASLAFILLTATFCVASEEEEMEVGIELVGCFADDANDRALPTLFENVRDKIIWSNMNETVRMCADAAANHDPPYMWFGIQFYGECWTGADAEVTYNKYGPSTNCWNGVGKHLTNAVYRFVMKGK
ncbi:uncharacterized protein LOC135683340 [Rhopilema esculentum]|uniref:uncharacterized protein LOC135683340 n=1 Tax=Rhopilema esculentum TaxID=499914 RepID=UPI0031DBE161